MCAKRNWFNVRLPRWGTLAIACLLACFPTRAQQPAPAVVRAETLNQLDTSEALTRQVAEDRLLKYLIKTAPVAQGRNLLARELLEKVAVRSFENGSALQLIGTSLRSGDELLRRALIKVFQTYNFTPAQTEAAMLEWSGGQPSELVRNMVTTLAQRPQALAPLVQYLLDTPDNWPSVLARTWSVLAGREYLTPQMLQAALTGNNLISASRVTEVLESANRGDPAARLRLASSLLELLPTNGTVARYLKQPAAAPPSWYSYIWQNTVAAITANQPYLAEYLTRLKQSYPLYNQWRNILIDSLAENGEDFFAGYLAASAIPRSRFNWTVAYLLENDKAAELASASSSQLQRLLRERLLLTLRGSERFCDWILWQLTRPAEALALTLRLAIPAALKEAPETNRALAARAEDFPRFMVDALRAAGAFSGTDKMSEFTEKAAKNQLDQDALQRFGTAFGTLLAADDQAWQAFWGTNGPRGNESPDNDVRQQVIREVISKDVASCVSLIQTLQTNDLRLRTVFGKWLIDQGKLPSDTAYDNWLRQLQGQLSEQKITGNPEIANFKSWMLDFLRFTPGWKAFEGRINAESTGVNFALRDALAARLTAQPDMFWKTFSMTTGVPGDLNSSLRPRMKNFILNSQTPEDLLRAISEKNQAATDILFPVWEKLLAAGAPVTQSIVGSILEGNFLGDLYFVFLEAFFEATQAPENAKVLQPAIEALNLADGTPDPAIALAQAKALLRTRASQALPVLAAGMQNERFFEAWRTAFLAQVRIFGKSYVVADHIIRNEALQDVWNEQVATGLFQEPALMEQLFRALVVNKQGNTEWVGRVRQRQQRLARILLEDRIMFEQLLANKRSLFAQALRGEISRLFGDSFANDLFSSN